MPIISLIFLLLALVMVITTFFPTWNFSTSPVVTPGRLIALIIGLLVLYVIYYIVVLLFGGGPVLAR